MPIVDIDILNGSKLTNDSTINRLKRRTFQNRNAAQTFDRSNTKEARLQHGHQYLSI